MISRIIAFFKSLFFPDILEDPKNLRIDIPKCTFIMCDKCNSYFIKEHSFICPCLKKNVKDS